MSDEVIIDIGTGEDDPLPVIIEQPVTFVQRRRRKNVPLNPKQYIPLINTFIGHWQQSNITAGGTPATEIKLKGNYNVANLITDRDALQVKITDIQAKLNLREDSASARDIKKTTMRGKLTDFRNAVLYNLDGTAYTRGLPTLPPLRSEESEYLKPFDDMVTKWTIINGLSGVPNFTAPLLLQGGYNLATFTTDLTDLRAAFALVRSTEEVYQAVLVERDRAFTAIYARLREYTLAIRAKFAVNSSPVMTLPKLSLSGNPTPKPVTNIVAQWNSTTNEAIITYAPSTSANIVQYDLRYSPSNPYSAADETTIATNTPDVLMFHTNHALTASGDRASFRLVTVNDTANEKGAKPFTITRP